jgi:DNA-binding transcriptional ArsR family regulator
MIVPDDIAMRQRLLEDILAENEQIRAENNRLREALSKDDDNAIAHRYEVKISEHEKEIKWQNDLDRDTELSAAHKLLLRQLRQIIKRIRYDMNEPVHIYVSELVGRTGLGKRSIPRLLSELAEYGLITKETRRKRVGNEVRNELWISLAQHIRTDATLIQAPKRNHGGNKQCEKCGSENVDMYITYICRDCGHAHKADIAHLGGL